MTDLASIQRAKAAKRIRALTVIVAALWLLKPSAPAADDSVQPAGDFHALSQYTSQNGVLNATFVAAPRVVVVDGARLNALVFNGQYGGPVLRLRPGDRLKLRLVNHTCLPLNLHFHGSYASPKARGDNVHVMVAPGASFDYRLTVPMDQPPGLYWYHTHVHGLSEQEVNAGLSGAMIIEGMDKAVPETATVRSRLLVLKSFNLPETPDASTARLHGVVQSINGAAHAEIHAAPGATEFWRISNQSANDYFHLSIKGAHFRIVGMDGAPTRTDIDADRLDIPPAGRIEAMVTLPAAAGAYALLSGSTPTGSGRNFKVVRELAVVKLEGGAAAPVSTRLAGVRSGIAPPDLRQALVSAKREVVFSQVPGQEIYLINGRTFDHDRIDVSVPLGSVEEWKIRNDSDDMHVFHIHQLHFQVVSINGQPQPFSSQLDTVRIPERGEVVVRIPFTNPEMVGRFVYHCHVLKHEDRGMMANIEVYDPKIGPDLSNVNLQGRTTWWDRLVNRSPVIGYICHSGALAIKSVS